MEKHVCPKLQIKGTIGPMFLWRRLGVEGGGSPWDATVLVTPQHLGAEGVGRLNATKTMKRTT
jgi:hypothetical protein